MKKKWEKPVTVVQGFEPNEYVAACWGVACSWQQANAYEMQHDFWDGGNVSHAADHCGNATNQVIHTNASGQATGMTEVGTDGLGNLPCTLTNPNYSGSVDIGTVQAGETIYWTTSSGNRVWHHVGTVTSLYEDNPNRS